MPNAEELTARPHRASRYRHAWWLLYVPFYLLLYQFAEQTVTTGYWVSYIPLDDHVPFLAPFVFFYVLWYPLLAGTGIWLILHDAAAFRRYIWSIMAGFTGTMLFCLLFPNGQDLRPAVVPGNGLDAVLLRAIYAADTNTNVLPSMHVIGTMAILFAIFDSPTVRRPWRIAIVALGILINLSTVIIKQHSLLDLFAGLLAGALIYLAIQVGIRRLQDRRSQAAANTRGRISR